MAKWMPHSLVDDQFSIQLPQFEACDHLHCTAEAHDKQQRHCDLGGECQTWVFQGETERMHLEFHWWIVTTQENQKIDYHYLSRILRVYLCGTDYSIYTV